VIGRRFGLLAALAARAGAGDAAADLPARVRCDADQAYGPDPAQRLDLYRPAGEVASAPLILFVHGGGWRRGDKAMPHMVRHKVAHWVPQGWLFASINYRMLPQAGPLQQAEDVARALAFVQARAAGWGVDPAHIVLMGHSAGAHLAALLAADHALAAGQGAAPWCATVAIDTAAFDMVAVMQRPHFPFYDPVFGTDPAFWRAASPTHRLTTAPLTPMLLVCSSRRSDSLPPAREFAARAEALGGQVTVLPVDLGHREINEQLGQDASYTAAIDAFLQARRAGNSPPGRPATPLE
jgi:acetyl esterase/lipase